jgi:hypothetical protein
MSKYKRIFDLEERLVDFAVRIIRTAESRLNRLSENVFTRRVLYCILTISF